jgi:hypothetical protein
MAIKIPLPTNREFRFKLEDEKLVRVEGEEYDGFVRFRQGTQEQDQLRSQRISSNRKYIWREGQMEEPMTTDPMDLARMEVEMTIEGTDIQHPDGSALKFESGKVSKEDFMKWWTQMPGQWGLAIYQACLEVNPTWAYKSGFIS